MAVNSAVIYLGEIMFVSLNNNTTDVTSVAETDNPSKATTMLCRREWCIQQSSSISMGTEDQVKHNMQ
jgi:hypothetical protein